MHMVPKQIHIVPVVLKFHKRWHKWMIREKYTLKGSLERQKRGKKKLINTSEE